MTLFWFLLVVSAISFGSIPAEAVELRRAVGSSVMLVAGWCLLIQMAATTTRHSVRCGLDPLVAARSLERQLDILRWLGLVVSAVCMVGFGLAAAVQTWPVFERSMTLQWFVLLSPALATTISVWCSEHRYGLSMDYTDQRGWPAAVGCIQSLSSAGGWILVPVFAIFLATDLIGWLNLFDKNASAAAVASVAGLVSIPVLVPLAVKLLWRTRRPDDEEQVWIGDVLRTASVAPVPVRIWLTGMKSSNALVAGFFPGMRTMLISDRLLRDLSRPEVAMVILHELAHVRRGHIWIRMLAMAPSWLAAWAISATLTPSPLVSVATNLVAIGLTLVTLRLVAHATEHDADRWACVMSMRLPAGFDPPETMASAAERYSDALCTVTGSDQANDRASWLHPSVRQRCNHLRDASNVSAQRQSPPLRA